ncbi:MAG: hypothetical protein JXN64_02320 [Spirochaetes bacterium]|nr:hypothetical protein [Spirochaetota bacterium]
MEKKLLTIIKDWVFTNKKIFWKYEVSSFYETYKISIANLPKPSKNDIKVKPNNRLLTDSRKIQLCNSIKKASINKELKNNLCINVKVDYIKDTVVADFI